MTTVDWLCVMLPCVPFGWLLALSVLAWVQPKRSRLADRRNSIPPISVLVPVCSPAAHLHQCVETLLKVEYDQFEIVLVASVHDGSAREQVSEQATRGPNVRALQVALQPSPNPKVGLLAAALEEAQYEILLFTDDNTLSSADRFWSHLERMDEGYRLVSAAVIGVHPIGFWGHVDAAFMNGHFARLQLAGDCVGLAGVMGKSMLIRRSDLQEAGGMLRTGASLCEDAALQKGVAQIGGRTALSRTPVTQLIGRRHFSDVWSRHRRWFFCRRTHVPWAFATEIITSAAAMAFFGALAADALGFAVWIGLLGAPGLLLLLEMVFLTVKRWPVGGYYPVVWIARELLVLPLWITALRSGTVMWRRQRLSLKA